MKAPPKKKYWFSRFQQSRLELYRAEMYSIVNLSRERGETWYRSQTKLRERFKELCRAIGL